MKEPFQKAITLVGRNASFDVVITDVMIQSFAELSGDQNALHTSDTHAISLGYPGRVAHGMLLAALVSRLVGEYLPGGDTLLLSLKIGFHKPTHTGDHLQVYGEVVTESASTQTLDINFDIRHSRGVACKGTVLVKYPTGKI